jgi:ABC-2 type transport system permease protein
MNRMLVVLRKDLRELMTSRTTYSYLIIPIFLSFTYLAPAKRAVDALTAEGINRTVIAGAMQTTVNGFFYTLPLIIMMLTCSMLSSYAVIMDKTRKSLESLLSTPLSLRQVWMAKSLAVSVPSVAIGLVMTVIMAFVIEMIVFVPVTGFIMPSPLSLVTGIVVVPILTLTVVSIVTCLQLIITNPRLASLIFTVLFLAVFLSTAVTSTGLRLDLSLIYLLLAVVFFAVNVFVARYLTKERIILSSKA